MANGVGWIVTVTDAKTNEKVFVGRVDPRNVTDYIRIQRTTDDKPGRLSCLVTDLSALLSKSKSTPVIDT